MGRTAQLTSRRCILNTYSTNIRTEYFKCAAKFMFFSLKKCRLFYNSTSFGSCIIQILNTGCAKIKKKAPAPKG
jgi:type VI protein secretion system component VasA